MKILIFLLFISISISSQTIQGYIHHIADTVPVANAMIKNIKNNQSTFSDDTGSFCIEGNDTDTIVFTHNYFSTTQLTIRNISNAKNKVYLFPQSHIELPEVTIMPFDVYNALYKTAATNLKKKLITDEPIAYRCTGMEKELNIGDERSIIFNFTAKQRKKLISRKEQFNYDFALADLQAFWDSPKSKMMKEERLRTHLFYVSIKNSLQASDTNLMWATDSTIIIQSKSPTRTYTYTINKCDTTLAKVIIEAKPKKEKYIWYITFKLKEMYRTKTCTFEKERGGYYLSQLILNDEFSFLVGKQEERIILSYKTQRVSEFQTNTTQEFEPITHYLFRKKK